MKSLRVSTYVIDIIGHFMFVLLLLTSTFFPSSAQADSYSEYYLNRVEAKLKPLIFDSIGNFEIDTSLKEELIQNIRKHSFFNTTFNVWLAVFANQSRSERLVLILDSSRSRIQFYFVETGSDQTSPVFYQVKNFQSNYGLRLGLNSSEVLYDRGLDFLEGCQAMTYVDGVMHIYEHAVHKFPEESRNVKVAFYFENKEGIITAFGYGVGPADFSLPLCSLMLRSK